MEIFLRECEIIGIPKLIPEPVDLCPDEDASIRQQQFSFRPISEIENAENNSILDVIGVVITVNPLVPILRKNGMETQRRVLKLEDQSGRSVELTMWGEFCNKEGHKLQEMVDSGFFPVVALKAGKVSGKSIGTISSSQLFINPDSPEGIKLRQWFEKRQEDELIKKLCDLAERKRQEEEEEEDEEILSEPFRGLIGKLHM